jgi:hypothetical protein
MKSCAHETGGAACAGWIACLITRPGQILNEALAYLTAVTFLCYTPVRVHCLEQARLF